MRKSHISLSIAALLAAAAAAHAQQPASRAQQPASRVQQPASRAQQSASQQPASHAQQPATQVQQPDSEAKSLSDAEIKAAFSGKRVEWGGFGVAKFEEDGDYEYTVKENGQHFRGKFVVGANRLCYDFPTGQSQCDRIMKDKDGIYMINGEGTVYRAKFLN